MGSVIYVPRVDSEVVVGLVLDQRVVPAVADKGCFEIYVVSLGKLFFGDERVLFFNVLIDNGRVVTPIGLMLVSGCKDNNVC